MSRRSHPMLLMIYEICGLLRRVQNPKLNLDRQILLNLAQNIIHGNLFFKYAKYLVIYSPALP